MSKVHARKSGPVRTVETSLNTRSKATSPSKKRGPVRTSTEATTSYHSGGPAGRSGREGSKTKRGVRTQDNTPKF